MAAASKTLTCLCMFSFVYKTFGHRFFVFKSYIVAATALCSRWTETSTYVRCSPSAVCCRDLTKRQVYETVCWLRRRPAAVASRGWRRYAIKASWFVIGVADGVLNRLTSFGGGSSFCSSDRRFWTTLSSLVLLLVLHHSSTSCRQTSSRVIFNVQHNRYLYLKWHSYKY